MAKLTKLKRLKDKKQGDSLPQLIVKLSINTFALLVVAYVVPGFVLQNLQAAIVAAVILGVVNTFLRPVIQLIALPLTLLTLGLAAFFVNVGILWFVAKFVPGFVIDTFITAIIGSLLLTLTSWFLHKLAKN